MTIAGNLGKKKDEVTTTRLHLEWDNTEECLQGTKRVLEMNALLEEMVQWLDRLIAELENASQ